MKLDTGKCGSRQFGIFSGSV